MWLHLVPYRGSEERMSIRTDRRVRFTSGLYGSDSGVHGEWSLDIATGHVIIHLHYRGNETHVRRVHDADMGER